MFGSTASYSQDAFGTRAFLIPLDFELHGIPVFESPVALGSNHTEVNKDILGGFRIHNESKALFVVKPLYCSFFHGASGNSARPNSASRQQWRSSHGASQSLFGNNFVTNEVPTGLKRHLPELRPSVIVETRVAAAGEGIPAAASLLSAGEVVALPTETVYGLGADALNPAACVKIFEAKERPLSDPLIVHIPAADWLDRLSVVPDAARRLAEKFWPGPLTLVLPRREIVPDLVTAGQETVAIRMSSHPLFQEVLEAFGKPVAAPSANRFGRISPTCPEHVLAELGGRISLILDGGPCRHGLESTIVLVNGEGLHILRHGPVTAEELDPFGPVRGAVAGISAPGGLQSHYAPRTPMRIGEPVEQVSRLLFPRRAGNRNGRPATPSIGLLAWSSSGGGFAKVEHLTLKRDLREAAANLYGAMRRLDEAGLDGIIAEPLPETGLGAAIMERLRKASAR